tara:strand:+ start:102 stop:503 length:402 start_codon:yes stop_codon:yes gene_type:complete
MSYMSVDGVRSSDQHAGIPARVSVAFDHATGADETLIAAHSSRDGASKGQSIKVHSYMISLSQAGKANLCASGGSTTSMTGEISNVTAALPFAQNGFEQHGVFTLPTGQDLTVSSNVNGTTVGGNVVYSILGG